MKFPCLINRRQMLAIYSAVVMSGGCDVVFDLNNQNRARQTCAAVDGYVPSDFENIVITVTNLRDVGMPRGRAEQISCCSATTDLCACVSATVDFVYGREPDITDNAICQRDPGAAYDTDSTLDERLAELRDAYADPQCPEGVFSVLVAACAEDTQLVRASYFLGADTATYSTETRGFIAYETVTDGVDPLCAGWSYWPTIPQCLNGQVIEVICGDVAVGDPITTAADCLVDP